MMMTGQEANPAPITAVSPCSQGGLKVLDNKPGGGRRRTMTIEEPGQQQGQGQGP